MMYPTRTPQRNTSPGRSDLLLSIFDSSDVGLIVLDESGRTQLMNASARALFDSQATGLPQELVQQFLQLAPQLHAGKQLHARWSWQDTIIKVRARHIDETGSHTVLELSLFHAPGTQSVPQRLATELRLSSKDAELLSLIWRGLSNHEISEQLSVRVGTIKSRLFRLYQKLGVNRRPAAVLRAAEALNQDGGGAS